MEKRERERTKKTKQERPENARMGICNIVTRVITFGKLEHCVQ